MGLIRGFIGNSRKTYYVNRSSKQGTTRRIMNHAEYHTGCHSNPRDISAAPKNPPLRIRPAAISYMPKAAATKRSNPEAAVLAPDTNFQLSQVYSLVAGRKAGIAARGGIVT